MKYIIIGKIVNTHGIKGELRILSDFKYKDKIFKKGFPLYIGHTKEKEIINTYRPHKQFDMVTFNNYNNINEVLKYKGEYVFINKEDLELNSNQYLNEDLIGLDVITQNKSLGTLKKIEKYSSKYTELTTELAEETNERLSEIGKIDLSQLDENNEADKQIIAFVNSCVKLASSYYVPFISSPDSFLDICIDAFSLSLK